VTGGLKFAACSFHKNEGKFFSRLLLSYSLLSYNDLLNFFLIDITIVNVWKNRALKMNNISYAYIFNISITTKSVP
jgi:hypothetical protein